MRKILPLVAIVLLLAAPQAIAQKAGEEPIETDRDSFTPAVTTAGAGRLILETGYSFIDNRGVPETHSLPEYISRYGFNDWLELRLGTNYEVGGESNAISGGGGGTGDLDSGEIESEAKMIYGFKAAITEQADWIPRSVTIVQATTPTRGPETATHLVAAYVWGWELAEDWVWDSAIRYGDGSEEDDQFDRWAPSTVLKVEVIEQWNAHIEYFGIFTDGRSEELSQSHVSPGVHYLITQNFEVGVRIGWGLGGDAANFFSNLGGGMRF